VLVSGPHTLIGHESDSMIEYARRKGYDASLFRPLPHELNSTRSEAAFIDNYLRSQKLEKVLLVTSNFHTARAARLLRKYSPGVQVIAVAAPDPVFTPDGWWKTREGQKVFFLESVKPLGWIGSQLLLFFRPIVSVVWHDPARWDRAQKILEKRGAIELLLRRLEARY